jgi:hypothetical protein
LVFLLA